MKALILLLLLCGPAAAEQAEPNWRMRARENFESASLNLAYEQGNLPYTGALSAFNIFREVPWRYGYGFTFQYGALKRNGRKERVTVTVLGLEAKNFPSEDFEYWFVRGGLLATAIDPAGPGREMWNYGFSAGTGMEFPVWKLGIAPEVGTKLQWGSRGRRAHSLYFALGIHFYVMGGEGGA